MKMIIDRIEDTIAVVELPDGNFLDLPLALIPDGKEGDVVSVTIDRKETQKRAEKIQTMMQQIFKEK